MDLGSDRTRNYHDERVVHKSSMLYFNDLVDPGWRDPDFSSSNHSFAFSAKNGQYQLKSAYSSGRKSRDLTHLKPVSHMFDFPPCGIVHKHTHLVQFCDDVDITTFEVHDTSPRIKWRSVRSTTRTILKQYDSDQSVGYSGSPTQPRA